MKDVTYDTICRGIERYACAVALELTGRSFAGARDTLHASLGAVSRLLGASDRIRIALKLPEGSAPEDIARAVEYLVERAK